MKKILFILTLMIGLMSCNGGGENTANAKSPAKDRVEVMYFHGKQRCKTCMAIEQNTREVIEKTFANEVKNGTVVFRIIDISTPQGETTADKYEVTWSSLFVNKWKNGKETRNNMTEFGFGSAKNNPEAFKQGLTDKIRQSLK